MTMKSFAFPVAIVTASLAAMPVEADENRKSRAWLDTRGVLTLTDIERTTGFQLSSESRTKVNALLVQRNAQLEGFNDQIAQVLRDDQKLTDAQLAERVEKNTSGPWTPERLEAIRRSQPMRYQGLINRLKK